MLSMHENSVALYRLYRVLGDFPGSDSSPWQIALLDWWQFIGRREEIVMLRRTRSGRPGPTPASPTLPSRNNRDPSHDHSN
jgi:hypothetical protein